MAVYLHVVRRDQWLGTSGGSIEFSHFTSTRCQPEFSTGLIAILFTAYFYCPRKQWQYCFQRCGSVSPITHEPLHLAWWNFAWTCTLANSRSLLNIKVIGQRSRSHVFLCVVRQAMRSHATTNYVCQKLQPHSLGGASGGGCNWRYPQAVLSLELGLSLVL